MTALVLDTRALEVIADPPTDLRSLARDFPHIRVEAVTGGR